MYAAGRSWIPGGRGFAGEEHMKIIRGIKIGGLQQKIFNLMLVFIVALIGVFTMVSAHQRKDLAKVVEEARVMQQEAITQVSQETMDAVLNTSMARTTALQAYIADDLFADVRTNVLMLQHFAGDLFAYEGNLTAQRLEPPSAAMDGSPAIMLVQEREMDQAASQPLAVVSNMGGMMLSLFESTDKISSVFVGTPDGNMVLVNDRAGIYVGPDGKPLPLPIRQRPWYVQAAAAGELTFTGVELDAFTDTPMLECAAPVYRDGELMAVVCADVYLSSISDYVRDTASENGFLCVLNENGQVLFSPMEEGMFKAELSASAPDLRAGDNRELADFVSQALRERTPLTLLNVDGKDYYLTGSPMATLGWTVISVVEKEVTDQPTTAMLRQYDEINNNATGAYTRNLQHSAQTSLLLTSVLTCLAITSALVLASRVVKPLEHMTRRLNSLSESDQLFRMEDEYRTGDEIEILAETFASLSERTLDYIGQITHITAEKERISTELALATRIQADMLPHIYPAFPDRPEFDIYATMTPAKEVGGDFYDFFLIDDTHLGIVMADVSGKGVPAALFMMISKILVQNNAMAGRGPAWVLKTVNDQICSNNREEMFVTVWLGILDTATGKITAANAGHEYPVIMQADGRFNLVKDKHGFVVGGLNGVQYKEYELTLAPGSKLFLYTDGVPEANNDRNEMFGSERMLAALNQDPDVSPEQILHNVRAAVDAFAGDAEQFDDLTMLCLEYKGEKS